MRTSVVLVAVSLLILVFPASGQTQCGAKVGEWAYGPSLAAAGDGEYAVFSAGRVLEVADVSDLEQPRVVGSTTFADVIVGVVLRDSVVYVAVGEQGFAVVDISQPARPLVDGTWRGSYRVYSVVVVGDLAYLAASSDGVVILDVSDGSAPFEVGRLNLDGSVVDVAVHDGIAFLAVGDDGVQVVNISDPESPTLITTLDGFDRAGSVDVSADGGLLAVADRFDGSLWLFDVSDPSAPAQLSMVDFYDYALDVVLYGDWALVGNRTYGVRIFDISDPSGPEQVRLVDFDGQTEGLSRDGEVLYVANHRGGLGLLDITDPSDPEELGSIGATSDLRHADMEGGLMVAGAGGQLVVVDVSDPSAPVTLAAIETPGYADGAVLHGSYAFVADDYAGVTVVDVSQPSAPAIVAELEVCEVRHMVRSGEMLFLACSDEGIGVVDVSTPDNPTVLGRLEGFTAQTVAYANGHMYLTDYGTGVHIVDVSDPTSPEYVAALDVEGAVSHPPTVNGDLLFVIARDGVRIFDVSNPGAPVQVGVANPSMYVFGTAPVGDLLFTANIYGDEVVYDISEPTAPAELATLDTVVTREGEVTWEGSLVLVGMDDAGFEIFDLSECSSSPPTALFTWRPQEPEAGETVHFTDLSYGAVASWRWDFDDGGVTDERFPDHVFAQAGDYDVTFTVDGPSGPANRTETVSVAPRSGGGPSISEPGDFVSVIAAAAHAPGFEGTQWVTDVVLHNPGVDNTEARIWFMKADQDNSSADGVVAEIAAGTSVAFGDVVGSTFGEDDAAGAILVGSDRELLVTSRTYNDAPTGTYGQFIPGLAPRHAVLEGQTARLIELTRSSEFRTNFGVANPTPNPLTVHVTVVGADGVELAAHTLSVPPFGHRQRSNIVGTDATDAMALVMSSSAGAAYFPYASVVDNRTGDPIFVAPVWPADHQFIAAAAHVEGLENTTWRTDVEVCSAQQEQTTLNLSLLESRQDNSKPVSARLTLPADTCSRLPDVLFAEFDFDGTGALEITTKGDGVFVTSSRTYNWTPTGTFGQYLSGIPIEGALASGRHARMTQLRQSVDDVTGFRTNLGFVNTTNTPLTVAVDVYGANGIHLGTLEYGLKPYEHRQINRVFREVTSDVIDNGTIAVTTVTPGAAFIAYASVVDNVSGDPVYIPAALVGS